VVDRTGFVACFCAAALLVVAGCAGSPEPSVETPKKTSSTSATPSPSPTPTAPVMPAAAKEQTDEGVKAFVEYYYDLLAYGEKTNDWQAARDLSLPSCVDCANLTKPLPGRFAEGGEAKPTSIEGGLNPDRTSALVTVGMEAAPGVWLPSPDASPTPTKAEKWIDDVTLEYGEGSWKVKDLRLAEF
jgi:Family of unknown function (DUF6318)